MVGSGTGLNRLLAGSQGMQINRMLDGLGLPDSFGDMIGAQVDAANGDWAGYARNMADLGSGLSSGAIDAMLGKGLAGAHFFPRPNILMPKARKLWGNTFHTPFGTQTVSRERLGGRGFIGRMVGRSMEAAINTNPAFRAQMERVLGGRIIPDGRADGMITVQRFRPNLRGIAFGAAISSNPMLSGLYGALSRLEGNIKNMAQAMTKGGATRGGFGLGGVGGGGGAGVLKDPSTAELAKGMGMKAPLSFEDMLFLMMMKYAKKKEKEVMGKMNELSSKNPGNASKNAGLDRETMGRYKAAAAKIMKEGGPQASDTIKKMKLEALRAKMGIGVDNGGKLFDQKKSDTLKQMQMQKLMEDLKKMYEMLSNVMKSMNSMQMAAVRNLR